MNADRPSRTTSFLAIILWAGGMVQAGFSQSQPAFQGWKQFATSAAPRPSASSGWHYFGTSHPVPKPEPKPKPSGLTRQRVARPVSVSALEYQMYELINRDRLDPANAAENGGHAQVLRWNTKLAAAARQHSRDMLEKKFFAHVDREGRSPGTRVKAAGIEWQAVGENIAIYDQVPAAQAAFMNEPRFGHNHRSNILDPKYTEVGVGIVEAPDGRYYITQEFVETPQDLRAAF